MNIRTSLLLAGALGAASAASAQLLNYATGVAGISGSATNNVLETTWAAYYQPNLAFDNVVTPTPFTGTFADLTGYTGVNVRSVSQAGGGVWIDPRLASTYDNQARWIAPFSDDVVPDSGGFTNGVLQPDFEANSQTTRTNLTGNYAYVLRFFLTAGEVAQIQSDALVSSIRWNTDNRSQVFVNGNFVASVNLPAVNSLTLSAINESFFVVGLNEVQVFVRNNPPGIDGSAAPANPTGLVAFVNIPEPSTYALIGGLVALGVLAIRRRK